MHDPGPASISQKFRSVPKQPARRNAIEQPDESLPRVLHLDHLTAARSELLDHVAEVLLGDVDRQLLVRLEALAIDAFARDHSRARHLKLEPLTPHGLHEDREMQLAAARYGPRVGRSVSSTRSATFRSSSLVESIADLARRHVLPFFARERRVVDDVVDGNRRLLDGDSLEPLRVLDVRERQPNLDALDACQRDDLAGESLRDLDAIQSIER